MRFFLSVLGLATLASCVTASDDPACTPGQSDACTGPDGCSGFQVCNADGTAFEACECSAGTTMATSTTAAAGGGGSGATSTTGTSTSSGGGGGAVPWTPADLTGLALWLDSDLGKIEDPQYPGTILKWDDQSPNQLQAQAVSLQDGWRFVIDPSALNGHDAIRCPGNGTGLSVADHPALQWGTDDFMIAAVVRTDFQQSSPSFYWLKELTYETGVEFGLSAPGTLRSRLGLDTVLVGVPFSPAFHVAVMKGPALELHVGVSASTGPGSTVNADNVGAAVRLCAAGSNAQEIEMAEVIAARGPITDADVESVKAYLETKFGL